MVLLTVCTGVLFVLVLCARIADVWAKKMDDQELIERSVFPKKR